MFRTIIAVSLLLAISNNSYSETRLQDLGMDGFQGTLDSFFIDVVDEVTDGCLPNPNKLKDKMEIGLRRNGFKILGKLSSYSEKIVLINPLGMKVETTNGVLGCTVYLEVSILQNVFAQVPYSGGIEYPNNMTVVTLYYRVMKNIFTEPRSSMQARLEKKVEEAADQIYLEVSRSKDRIEKEYPFILENKK